MYPWTGRRTGVWVLATSQSEILYLNSMFLRWSGKRCLSVTRRFNSVSNSCSSRCKRAGSVDLVATICPGHVHTALNLQAPLRSLMIPRIQTNAESKPKSWSLEGQSYPTKKGDSFGAQKFHRQQSGLVAATQPPHLNCWIWNMWNTIYRYIKNQLWLAELIECKEAAGRKVDGFVQGYDHRVGQRQETLFFLKRGCLKSSFWDRCLFIMLYIPNI